MGYNYLFTDKSVEVFRREDSSIVFMSQLKNKLYLVDFSKSKTKIETCLVAKSSMGWMAPPTSPCWDEELDQTLKRQPHS
jgi:hypothetical protein